MRHTKTQELTTAKATSQAASRVRQVMAGELITANSRGSWDLDTDTHLVITTVSFPLKHPGALDARAALNRLPGVRTVSIGAGYLTVTRER
jgi:hypothetical protein